MGLRYDLLLLVVLVAGTSTGCGTTTVHRQEKTFGRHLPTYDEQGRQNPLVRVDLNELQPPRVRTGEIIGGRVLELRSFIEELDDADFESVVALARRCYRHVEGETGHAVDGDLLLYFLPYDYTANSYVISYRCGTEEVDRWAEVAFVLFCEGETVRGDRMGADLQQALGSVAPHEIAHAVVHRAAPVQHDLEHVPSGSRPLSFRTRWFDDGAAELVALGFTRSEFPDLADHDLYCTRRIDSVLEIEAVREGILDWPGVLESRSWDKAPPYELEMYGAALLLMMEWTRHVTLREILARLAAFDEPVDGDDLLDLVKETTGMGREEFVEAARRLGAQYAGGGCKYHGDR